MTTFYRGCNILNDKVLKGYTEGYYMDNGKKIQLSNNMTKYNIKFLGEINDLNVKWFSLILLGSTAVELMKTCDAYEQYEAGNLWHLIKAQSGTIRYNKLLRASLKNYCIKHQNIYNSINKDISKQFERYERNKKLVLDLLKDYGFETLIKLVEKQTGMEFIDHLYEYCSNYPDTEDHISIVVDSYIRELQRIASESGLDMHKEISQQLLESRKNKEEVRREADEIIKKKKEKQKTIVRNNAIDNDGVMLQSDIDGGRFNKNKKLGDNDAIKLADIVKRIYNGRLYYIAGTKRTDVIYITEDNKETHSILKAKYFSSVKEADDFMKQSPLNNEYYLKVMRLIQVVDKTNNQLDFLKAELKDFKVGAPSGPRNNMLRKILNTGMYLAYGYNLTDDKIRVKIYYNTIKGQVHYLCKEKHSYSLYSNPSNIVITDNNFNVNNINVTNLKTFEIDIHSKYCKKLMEMFQSSKQIMEYAFNTKSAEYFRAYKRAREYKENGVDTLYVVAYTEGDSVVFYNSNTKYLKSKSYNTMDVFADYESAVVAANSIRNLISTYINIIPVRLV